MKPLKFSEVGTEHCRYWCDPNSFYWRAGSRCTTLQFGKEFPRPKTSLTYLLCVAYCPDTCPLPSQFGVGQLRIKGKKGKKIRHLVATMKNKANICNHNYSTKFKYGIEMTLQKQTPLSIIALITKCSPKKPKHSVRQTNWTNHSPEKFFRFPIRSCR